MRVLLLCISDMHVGRVTSDTETSSKKDKRSLTLTLEERNQGISWLYALLDGHFSSNARAICTALSDDGIDNGGKSDEHALVYRALSQALLLSNQAQDGLRQSELLFGICTHVARINGMNDGSQTSAPGVGGSTKGLGTYTQPPAIYQKECLSL